MRLLCQWLDTAFRSCSSYMYHWWWEPSSYGILDSVNGRKRVDPAANHHRLVALARPRPPSVGVFSVFSVLRLLPCLWSRKSGGVSDCRWLKMSSISLSFSPIGFHSMSSYQMVLDYCLKSPWLQYYAFQIIPTFISHLKSRFWYCEWHLSLSLSLSHSLCTNHLACCVGMESARCN